MEFIVLIEEILRAWKGAGASRARPAWDGFYVSFLGMLGGLVWRGLGERTLLIRMSILPNSSTAEATAASMES